MLNGTVTVPELPDEAAPTVITGAAPMAPPADGWTCNSPLIATSGGRFTESHSGLMVYANVRVPLMGPNPVAPVSLSRGRSAASRTAQIASRSASPMAPRRRGRWCWVVVVGLIASGCARG